MNFLIAAVVLLGALCLLNLLVTFAVLRRLREHTAELESLASRTPLMPYVPVALIGRTLPASGAVRPQLVAFFDVHCDTCHERAPQFAVAARSRTALAVISGDGREADDLVEILGDGVSVITAEAAESMVRALGVEAFPTFLRVSPEGTVLEAGTELSELKGLGEMAPVI
ncbi:hypothetical protein ACFQX6_16350 [Streptosporangium lutulentum]